MDECVPTSVTIEESPFRLLETSDQVFSDSV